MELTFEKWEDGRWFVDLPDYDEMTAKSMSKSQITNNQLFNWIWRFEIIIVNLHLLVESACHLPISQMLTPYYQ